MPNLVSPIIPTPVGTMGSGAGTTPKPASSSATTTTNPSAGTSPTRSQFTTSYNPKPQRRLSVQSDGLDSESDEEMRTHYSVISRRLKKRRKTNQALVSNPHREVPQSKFELSPSSPKYGLDNSIGNDIDLDDLSDDLSTTPKSFQHQRYQNRRSAVPDSDLNARQRCYEYIHTAIDAVWAEYCNSTAYAESQKYLPNSPISDGDDFGVLSSGDDGAASPQQPGMSPQAMYVQKRNLRSDSISMQPLNQSLMKQKKRLVDAKYLLSHFVSAPDASSSAYFWQVWDHMKYNTAELVEGDDDEIEEVIGDLEEGRCF